MDLDPQRPRPAQGRRRRHAPAARRARSRHGGRGLQVLRDLPVARRRRVPPPPGRRRHHDPDPAVDALRERRGRPQPPELAQEPRLARAPPGGHRAVRRGGHRAAEGSFLSARPLATGPVRLGHHVLANRLVLTPHLGRLNPQRYLDYLRERVSGGAALVVTPAGGPTYGASIYGDPVARSTEGYLADQDALVPWAPAPDALAAWEPARRFLGEVASVVHEGGALVVGQIHHPGSERSWDTFQPVPAPSAIDGEWPAQHPHVLTDDEVEQIVAGYVANARLIVEAGLDGVEVHAAHGYLLNRFLSPAYNHRSGRYAGERNR
ncbi:MAG: hypothetical protein EON52_19630, partial [Actinomycetales bacterium]